MTRIKAISLTLVLLLTTSMVTSSDEKQSIALVAKGRSPWLFYTFLHSSMHFSLDEPLAVDVRLSPGSEVFHMDSYHSLTLPPSSRVARRDSLEIWIRNAGDTLDRFTLLVDCQKYFEPEVLVPELEQDGILAGPLPRNVYATNGFHFFNLLNLDWPIVSFSIWIRSKDIHLHSSNVII